MEVVSVPADDHLIFRKSAARRRSHTRLPGDRESNLPLGLPDKGKAVFVEDIPKVRGEIGQQADRCDDTGGYRGYTYPQRRLPIAQHVAYPGLYAGLSEGEGMPAVLRRDTL